MDKLTIDELDRLHAKATAGPGRMVFAVRAYDAWPEFSARLRAAEVDARNLRAMLDRALGENAELRAALVPIATFAHWSLATDDNSHEDDCGARGQHDRDVCTAPGCTDNVCEGPHCTCEATMMRDQARAALGEP